MSKKSATPNKSSTPSSFKKWLSATLILGSLLWIGSLIVKDWESIRPLISGFGWRNTAFLILATLFGTVTLWAQLFIFLIIFAHSTHKKLPFTFLSNIFFAGQVIRYVPGRFLSVVYQINETQGQVSPLTILKVNVEALMLTIMFHTVVCISIIAYYLLSPLVGIVSLCVGVFLFIYVLHRNLFYHLIEFLKPMLPKRIFAKIDLGDQLTKYSLSEIFKIVGIFTVSWICYLIAWQLFQFVFPQLSGTNTVLVCAAYNFSWIVGFVSMITPGGLGIREVCFIMITSKITTTAHIPFLAVFARLWLTFIDIFLYLINLIVYRMSKRGRPL